MKERHFCSILREYTDAAEVGTTIGTSTADKDEKDDASMKGTVQETINHSATVLLVESPPTTLLSSHC